MKVLIYTFMLLVLVSSSLAMLSSDPEVVRHYKLDSNLLDSSTNTQDASCSDCPSSTTGQLNTAYNFDGVNDRLNVPTFPLGSEITLSAWVYADSLCHPWCDNRIISRAIGININDHDFMLSTMPSASDVRLRFRLKTGGSTTTLLAPTGNMVDNTWYHAAATYDGSMMRLYLDGVLVGSVAKTGAISDSGYRTMIGANPSGATSASRFFQGTIDDVWVIDRALSQPEIVQLMSGSTLPTQCTISTDCSLISNTQQSGIVSMQGHYWNETDAAHIFPYNLCCPSDWGGTGEVSFKYSVLDGTGHVSINESLITNFEGNVTLGTKECNIRNTCLADEACVFKISDPDNGHIADCSDNTIPTINAYADSLCCKAAEVCYDGIDNDRDGYVDCADDECNGVNILEDPQECTGSTLNTNYCTGPNMDDCYGQPPFPTNETIFYCSYGIDDDPNTAPGACCPEGEYSRWVVDHWVCTPSAECGIDLTRRCHYDFLGSSPDFYPNNPPHWISQSHENDPNFWCNTQLDDLHIPLETPNYNGSAGCCLVPKNGVVDYWFDDDNVKVFG